jgi:hypothetical protein
MKISARCSRAHGEWVLHRLVPRLKAGGAEVLVAVERFRTGGGVYRQMDATPRCGASTALSASLTAAPYATPHPAGSPRR